MEKLPCRFTHCRKEDEHDASELISIPDCVDCEYNQTHLTDDEIKTKLYKILNLWIRTSHSGGSIIYPEHSISGKKDAVKYLLQFIHQIKYPHKAELKEMTIYRDGLANDYMEHLNQIAKLSIEKCKLVNVIKELVESDGNVELLNAFEKSKKLLEEMEDK